jgi:hypothetical protein
MDNIANSINQYQALTNDINLNLDQHGNIHSVTVLNQNSSNQNIQNLAHLQLPVQITSQIDPNSNGIFI